MSDFKYIVNNTEYDNSFLKSVIQATTGSFANQEDLDQLLEDIEMFFQNKVENNSKKIYKHIIDYATKLNIKLISGNTEDIFDLYLVADANKKQIIPLFSSKIKQELIPDANFYTFENYRYLEYYILHRNKQTKQKNYTKISLRDYINFLLNNSSYYYQLVMDIIQVNIIILDKDLKYVETYQKKENTKYIILLQDGERYKNVTLQLDDEKLNLLSKKEESIIINAIETNTSYYKEKTKLDSILEEIENNSSYSKDDFLSNINLLD